MKWIFGSFLVTPCALTSCYAVMSKQEYDSTSGQSDTTSVYPESDHVMRTTQSDLDRVQRIEVERRTRSRSEASLTIRLASSTSVGTPWLPEEDMGQEEVSYLSIYLSIYFLN